VNPHLLMSKLSNTLQSKSIVAITELDCVEDHDAKISLVDTMNHNTTVKYLVSYSLSMLNSHLMIISLRLLSRPLLHSFQLSILNQIIIHPSTSSILSQPSVHHSLNLLEAY
jgi:hypothetical protein